MTILHLTTFLQGGPGRVIVDLATSQRAAGHDVAVVASRTSVPGHGHYGAHIDALDAAGVLLRLVDSTFSREYAANLAVVRALHEMYPEGREPDVIHTHAAVPSLVALCFVGARGVDVPIVQTMHGWNHGKTDAHAAADIGVLNLVRRVAVATAESARVLVSLGVPAERLVVIPYGVGPESNPGDAALDDVDRQMLFDMDAHRRDGALVVVSVGTLGPQRNLAIAVEALARATGRANMHLWVVGGGDTSEIRDVVEVSRLESRVHFRGYSRAARQLAAAADVLIAPARGDGQSITMLEAFCDGAIVVAPDSPDLVALVEAEGVGRTFPADDPRALAEVLLDLAAMPHEARDAMRARARLLHRTRFTTAAMAERYAALYPTRAAAARPRIQSAA